MISVFAVQLNSGRSAANKFILTNCSRVIRNAWHFYVIVGFCVYGGLVGFRGSVAHPLTGRYVFWSIYDFTQLLQKLA